jgi:hypothetical protein
MFYTVALQRMHSTKHGLRRILKRPVPHLKYLRQAVETGVYRSAEELERIWYERSHSNERLVVIMRRFRQDIVRGASIHDYPDEYTIMRQFPPIPDPLRTPRKFRHLLKPKPDPLPRLLSQYLQRQKNKQGASVPSTDPKQDPSVFGGYSPSEEYYRELLGVPPPSWHSGISIQTAAVQRAYVSALKHYQLERTVGGMTQAQIMDQVDLCSMKQSSMRQKCPRVALVK